MVRKRPSVEVLLLLLMRRVMEFDISLPPMDGCLVVATRFL
jgi:hypothetical protein